MKSTFLSDATELAIELAKVRLTSKEATKERGNDLVAAVNMIIVVYKYIYMI